jgi:hypothetical protein
MGLIGAGKGFLRFRRGGAYLGKYLPYKLEQIALSQRAQIRAGATRRYQAPLAGQGVNVRRDNADEANLRTHSIDEFYEICKGDIRFCIYKNHTFDPIPKRFSYLFQSATHL